MILIMLNKVDKYIKERWQKYLYTTIYNCYISLVIVLTLGVGAIAIGIASAAVAGFSKWFANSVMGLNW